SAAVNGVEHAHSATAAESEPPPAVASEETATPHETPSMTASPTSSAPAPAEKNEPVIERVSTTIVKRTPAPATGTLARGVPQAGAPSRPTPPRGTPPPQPAAPGAIRHGGMPPGRELRESAPVRNLSSGNSAPRRPEVRASDADL